MYRILALAILVLTITSCGSDKSEETNTREKFISFKGEEFELSFPSEWVDATESNRNVTFVVVAPPDDKADAFTENVSVVIQPLPDTVNVQNFLKLTEQQMLNYFPNHTMINKKVTKKNGKDCILLEYQIEQNNQLKRFIQEAYIYNGKAYIVTFTAEQIIFREYQETAHRILDSFKIL